MRALIICIIAIFAIVASGEADARRGRPPPGAPGNYSTVEVARIASYRRALAEARRYDPDYQHSMITGPRGVPSNEAIRRVERDTAQLAALHGRFRTEAEAGEWAARIGFRRTNLRSRGFVVYQRGREYITRDRDSHEGGAWKRGRDPNTLGTRGARMGTYNRDLSVRLGP